MTILLDDVVQYADTIVQWTDVAKNLKSPALYEITELVAPLEITLDRPRRINSIGVGNATVTETIWIDCEHADAIYEEELDNGNAYTTIFENEYDCLDVLMSNFTVSFNDVRNTVFKFHYEDNGLYLMPRTVLASKIIITSNALTVGRIGAGLGINIPTAVAKEPGLLSSGESRMTLAGQSIQGRGGHNYKNVSLDSRYKLDPLAIKELENGFNYISRGYPFFINLKEESYKLPFDKLYAKDDKQQQIIFEGGIKKFLYSKRWDLRECF